ncbi:MAG TPA: cation:proton antiporter [Gemmatimonadaceae bacterium]|nr:cation:proton antiporter [Gemmatimonadaceae bacterium]
MRRIFVLVLLLGGMRLIQPLGSGGFGSQALLAFGFLILGAYAAGELAVALRIPKLVGYLAAGVAFGPSALNIVGTRAIGDLSPVSSLAIALIAFIAGAELRWGEVRERGLAIVRVLVTELGFTIAAVTALLLLLRAHVSFLSGSGLVEAVAFSIVFAAMAAVHSPAVAIALLSETRARGPVAKTTLGLVLISDVVIVLLLTITLAIARVLVPPTGPDVPALTLHAVVWEVIGAVLIGGILGVLVTLYLRFIRRELFLFAILIAFFGSEIAHLLRVEPLLTLMTTGFIVENVSAEAHSAALRSALERAAAPVFVVFFALAGADIALSQLARLWPLVVPLALVRGGAIWSGSRVGLRWSGLPAEELPVLDRHLWTGLLPQAGVAIGLAAVVAQTYPARGGDMRVLFLALVAINQAIGPILLRRGLEQSGEIPRPETDQTPDTAAPVVSSAEHG